MSLNIWRGNAPSHQMVMHAEPANPLVGDTFTLTITLDDGEDVSVSFVAPADPTEADIVAGLVDAWNTAIHPAIAGTFGIIAENLYDSLVVLTAKVSGVPFELSSSVTPAGAPGASLVVTTAQARSGPEDGKCAANWTLNRVPDTGDHIVLPVCQNGIRYGLDFSGITLAGFTQDDYGAKCGRFEDGKLYYLRIKTASCKLGGNLLTAVDLLDSAIMPQIDVHSEILNPGMYTVYLKGTALQGIDHRGGKAIVAGYTGDVATIGSGTNILVCGGTLTIGDDVTATGAAAIVHNPGTLITYSSIPTVDVLEDAVFVQAGGNWTTLNAHNRALVYPDADGNYGTLNIYGSPVIVFDRTLLEKALSAVNYYGSAEIRYNPSQTSLGTQTYYTGKVVSRAD